MCVCTVQYVSVRVFPCLYRCQKTCWHVFSVRLRSRVRADSFSELLPEIILYVLDPITQITVLYRDHVCWEGKKRVLQGAQGQGRWNCDSWAHTDQEDKEQRRMVQREEAAIKNDSAREGKWWRWWGDARKDVVMCGVLEKWGLDENRRAERLEEE